MKISVVAYVIGILLMLLAAAQLVPLFVAVLYGSSSEYVPFLGSIVSALAVGALLFLAFRGSDPAKHLRLREGFAVVAFGWAVISAFGAIPFSWIVEDLGYLDAYFETISGFTTTGASILTEPELLPRGLLFWRSFTHFFGGMGIVVLTVAILPVFGAGGYKLMVAEVPGPTADRIAPRIRETAKYLWIIYVGLTLVQIFALWPVMGLYDASCHAFATVATGGFSTKNSSVGHWNGAAASDVYVQVLIIVFMILSGINFALHINALRGKGLRHFLDSEFRFYMGLIVFATVVISAFLYTSLDASLGHCVRHAAFQVASLITTTGYGTDDYEDWPNACRALLLLLMFVGGCAGSTGGGVKCVRVLLLAKYGIREILQVVHPRAVLQVRINGVGVDREVVGRVMGFLALWFVVFGIAVILMTLVLDPEFNPDQLELEKELAFETAFGSVLATIGNIGPGIAFVGPAENFSRIPAAGKLILIFCMLLGRLEIYCILVLFHPSTWK